MKAQYEARGHPEPHHATMFEVPAFPAHPVPTGFAQMSRVTVTDEAKGAGLRMAWDALMALLGKESWGGLSVGEGEKIGLGLVGWDSLEQAKSAYEKPEGKAAWEKYHTLGNCKDVMVKMETY